MTRRDHQPDPDCRADAAVRAHLERELEPHVGGARAAFERRVTAERNIAGGAVMPTNWRWPTVALAGLAAAAAVAAAAFLTGPSLPGDRTPPGQLAGSGGGTE